MVSRSTVTALVPAYQAADFIQDTLDSLSKQTYTDFDVIISVDHCSDDTHAICAAHCAADQRFRLFRHDHRLGYVGNCNFLLGQAASDYVLFAFHDDLLAPTYVERLAAALDARPQAINAYSDVLLTPLSGEREHWVYTEMDGITDRLERGLRMLARDGQWWVPNRGLFRLDAARRIGGLKPHDAGEFSADWPWLLHMALLGEFVRVPETLCFKFYKPGSISRHWAFSLPQWYEASASCMREIWISELTTDEKMRLAIPLIKWLDKAKPVVQAELAQGRPPGP